MPDHEPLLALGRDPEQTVVDLAVGAADADLEHAHEHLARAGRRRLELLDPGRAARRPGVDDERLH